MKIIEIRRCPYRDGSGRAERFRLYKEGMTLEEYLKAGGKRVAWDRDVEGRNIILEGQGSAASNGSALAPLNESSAPYSESHTGTEAYPVPSSPRRAARRSGPANGSRPRFGTTDIIMSVVPNPCRGAGGRKYRYEHFREGISVEQFIARGGKKGDVRWALRHNFIVLASQNAASESDHDARDPDEQIPAVKSAISKKAGAVQDRFWVFADCADGSRWRLKQEIYSSAEADYQREGVMLCGYIKPKWWMRVG